MRVSAPGTKEPARKARKRTDEIAEAIKRTIMEHGLEPGDRLPQEKDLIAQYAASKGTVRGARVAAPLSSVCPRDAP